MPLIPVGSGTIRKISASPLLTHDTSKDAESHLELQAGDVLPADRGFYWFAHLGLLLQRGVHGLLRVYQPTIVDFTPHRPRAEPGRGKSDRKKE